MFFDITTTLIEKALEALKLMVIRVFPNSHFCFKARILCLAKKKKAIDPVFLKMAGSFHSLLRKCLPNI